LSVEPLEDRAVPANFTAASVPELIAAIDAANLNSEADTITLAPGTTFTLTEVNNTTNVATGLPVIMAGENLTIVGNGDIIERSTAAGTPAFRLFDVAAGASLTLGDLTLQGGLASGSSFSSGGAVFSTGTLALHGVTVQRNTAQGGPGINFGGWIETPGGWAVGGGVYSRGTLTMDGCTIQNNKAIGGPGAANARHGTDGGDAFGGGVYVGGGTATISGTSLTSNTAQGGDGGKGGGRKGRGVGGGLFISADAPVSLDAFTVDHVKRNRASSSDNNIAGSYVVIL
jgi:hypothetical protein